MEENNTNKETYKKPSRFLLVRPEICMGILLLFGAHIGKKPFLPVVSKRALFYVKVIFRQTDNVLYYW